MCTHVTRSICYPGSFILYVYGIWLAQCNHPIYFLSYSLLINIACVTSQVHVQHLPSSLFLCEDNGSEGSWITKTFTTARPSLVRALATLKNLVLPKLKFKNILCQIQNLILYKLWKYQITRFSSYLFKQLSTDCLNLLL